MQSNFSIPPPSMPLSVANTMPTPSPQPPHNALLVPPHPAAAAQARGNTGAPRGDFATIAAIAAALQANPNAFAASLAAMNVSFDDATEYKK